MVLSRRQKKALIVPIPSANVGPTEIRPVIDVLRRGGIIAYPTDTFYGLGCDAFSGEAVRKIAAIKEREVGKPMPCLISDIDMAERLTAELTPLFRPLTARFWPGPLTVVLKAAAGFPTELVGQKRTIGLRLPDVPWLREFIRRAGFPLVATSANISGAREIDSAEDVIRQFDTCVDVIIDGGRTPGGRPSTVIDLTAAKPVILREGAVPAGKLDQFLRESSLSSRERDDFSNQERLPDGRAPQRRIRRRKKNLQEAGTISPWRRPGRRGRKRE